MRLSLFCFGVLCLVFLGLSLRVFYLFDEFYGLPFGMNDVDVYMCWFGVDLGTLNVCLPFGGIGFYTHAVFYYSVLVLGDPSEVLLWFVPLLLCVCFPVSVLFCFYGFYRDVDRAVLSAVVFFFGTFGVLLFGVTSLWSQLYASIFYFLGLGFFFLKRYRLFLLFGIVSILTHPFMGVMFGLLVLSEVCRRSFKIGCLCVGLCLVILFLGGVDVWIYTVFGDTGFNEPPLYNMLGLFTNPLLWVFFIFGLTSDTCRQMSYGRYRLFSLFLLLMLFSHLGRGLVYLHFVVVGFAVIGYMNLRGFFNYPVLLDVFMVLFGCLWWNEIFGFLMLNMYYQLSVRGLNPAFFEVIFTFSPV